MITGLAPKLILSLTAIVLLVVGVFGVVNAHIQEQELLDRRHVEHLEGSDRDGRLRGPDLLAHVAPPLALDPSLPEVPLFFGGSCEGVYTFGRHQRGDRGFRRLKSDCTWQRHVNEL